MLRKTISLFLIILMIFAACISASGKEIEISDNGLDSDSGIIAGYYDTNLTTLSSDADLPEKYSSYDLGLTTPARNQTGPNCWAYASTATMESIILKKSTVRTQKYSGSWMSPEHMNAWGSNRDQDYGWTRSVNSGGFPYIAAGYLISWQGSRLESEYPADVDVSEFDRYDTASKPRVGATSLVYLNTDDKETIKQAIYDYGAIVGNFHMSSYMNYQTYSYYCNLPGLTVSRLNGHAISVIGWDDNYSRNNFNSDSGLPEKNGAWLCKNSYGDYWGLNGNFWISYEDLYLFSDMFGPSYAVTSVREMTSSTKLMQNEIYGSDTDFDINSLHLGKDEKIYDTVTYANVYDFEDGFRRIEDIIIACETIGQEFEIYHIPLENDIPSSDESTWTLIKSGTTDHTGYTLVDTDDFIVEEGRCAIGVKVFKSDEGYLSLGCDEWFLNSGNFIFKPNSQKGLSYILGIDDKAVDLLDYYEDNLTLQGEPDTLGSTFVIKAVTSQLHDIGDVSLDNSFSIIDATFIQRLCAKLMTFDDEQNYVADINYDDTVDIADATTIQQILARILSYPNSV